MNDSTKKQIEFQNAVQSKVQEILDKSGVVEEIYNNIRFLDAIHNTDAFAAVPKSFSLASEILKQKLNQKLRSDE